MLRTLLTAVAASLVTAIVMNVSAGSASSSRTFTLRPGEFVNVPAVHWTCDVSTAVEISRHPSLDCNKNTPVSPRIEPNVWVTRTSLVVTGTGSRPTHRDREYEFGY